MLGALMKGYAQGLKLSEESEQRQLGLKKQKLELEQEENKRAYQQELKETIAQLNKEHDDARNLVEQSGRGITVDADALSQAKKTVDPFNLYSTRSSAMLALRRKYGLATEEDEAKAFERGEKLQQLGVMKALQNFQSTGNSEDSINIMRGRGLSIPEGSQFRMIEDPGTKMPVPALFDPQGKKIADVPSLAMSYVPFDTYAQLLVRQQEGARDRASREGIARGSQDTSLRVAEIGAQGKQVGRAATAKQKALETVQNWVKQSMDGLGVKEKAQSKEWSDYYGKIAEFAERLMNQNPAYVSNPLSATAAAEKFLLDEKIISRPQI
jgi:hypothetical protein